MQTIQFGFHVGGGVEVFVTEHFAFNADFKFMWSNVETSVTGLVGS